MRSCNHKNSILQRVVDMRKRFKGRNVSARRVSVGQSRGRLKICVSGLGFAGLTLAIALADAGAEVHGVEINRIIVEKLQQKKPTLSEKSLGILLSRHLGANFFVHDSIPSLHFDSHIICVGTPVDERKKPIADYVLQAAKQVGNSLKGGELVAIRSTVPVGATRNEILPALEQESGKMLERDFQLVYTPERTAEGNAFEELRFLPQIIGGTCEAGVLMAVDMFGLLTPTLVTVSSLEAAEMIKLIDNSYRDYRFAYSNEISMICEHLGLDASECISKANISYPRNDIPLPSPGVGGPCLSKDPYILFETSSRAGYEPRLILNARKLNETVPKLIAEKLKKHLGDKSGMPPKIFLMGFSFKGTPSVDDIRNSTTLDLLRELEAFPARLFGHDPVVQPEKLKSLGVVPTTIEGGFKGARAVVIMTNDPSYAGLDIVKLAASAANPVVIADCWRLYDARLFDSRKIEYIGIGLGAERNYHSIPKNRSDKAEY